ncbi:MAG: LysR family transcriptional regulator [Pseudomonadota bacterium]
MFDKLRFDLVDLRLFLHVIDSGSITAGSRLSHLALASASARIRGMENAIGMTLLERSRAGVSPTRAGEAVAHHARLVRQQLERMQGELGDHAGGLTGKVRLLCNTAAITDYLPAALAAFLNAHPAMDIDLEEKPSHLIVSHLLGRTADLGIVADSVALKGLEYRPFRQDQLVLIAAKGSTLGLARHIGFAEALSHDFVGLDEDSALQQHLNLQAAQLGLRMRTRIRLRSFEAICCMVVEKVGVAVVPALAAARHAKEGRLRILKLDDVWASRQLLVCTRRFDELSLPVRRLVESLVAGEKKPEKPVMVKTRS